MSTQELPKGIVGSDGIEDIRLTPSRERWIAAVHEAGHAVIALSLGYELKDVSISNAYHCRIRLTLPADEPAGGLSAPEEEEERCDALYTLAGGKAELELPGIVEEMLSASDREHFKTLGPHNAAPEVRAAWRSNIESEAERIVRHHWDSILVVANALLDRDYLSHAEVRQLLGG